jgi:hypothetical protein
MYNHPASSVIATMAVAMTNIRFVSMWRTVSPRLVFNHRCTGPVPRPRD